MGLRPEAVTEAVVGGRSRKPCALPQDHCFSLQSPSSADDSVRATWAPGGGCGARCHGALSLASLTRWFPISQRQLGVRPLGPRAAQLAPGEIPGPSAAVRIQRAQPALRRRSNPGRVLTGSPQQGWVLSLSPQREDTGPESGKGPACKMSWAFQGQIGKLTDTRGILAKLGISLLTPFPNPS